MKRKEMVQKVLERLGGTSLYLGAPSFAYEVRTSLGVYRITRDKEFVTIKGKPLTFHAIMNPMEHFAIAYSLEPHTGQSLTRLVNSITSKQELIMQAFKTDAPFLEDGFAEDLDKIRPFGVYGFSETLDNRCVGFALDFSESLVVLTLRAPSLTTEQCQAFSALVRHMNEAAITGHGASFKKTQLENPKYAMRNWLYRLGMGGDSYKETRKVLLENLAGSAAFRK